MTRRWVIARVVLTCLLLLQSVGSALAVDDARIQAYEQQLERMQREMDEMRERLRALEAERKAPAPAAAAPATGAPATTASGAPSTTTAPVAAAAAPAAAASTAQVADQDKKMGILAQEIEALKSALVLPKTKELKGFYGLGPAASKVYQVERGLSIGGYGEYNYQKFVSDQQGKQDQFDMLRFVLYTGYKFTDRIVLNTEFEVEHALVGEGTATSDSGEAEVEFAYLDFFFWQQINARAGLLLVPMGFINEIHEPPYFFGVFRPEVERRIIPTTWREGGVGIFGTLAPGLDYRAYLMNSLNAEGFSSSGIRGGRQSGDRALAEDFAGVVRLDYTPFPGGRLGGSVWMGDSGQDNSYDGEKPGAFTLLWETHAELKYRGLEFRALGAFTHIDDAAILSRALQDTIASDQYGFYVEAGYDVLPLIWADTTQYFAPFFRYEQFDTQDKVPQGFVRVPGNDVKLYQVGFSYKPHPQVVIKLDYRNFKNGNVDPTPDEVNIGAGYVF